MGCFSLAVRVCVGCAFLVSWVANCRLTIGMYNRYVVALETVATGLSKSLFVYRVGSLVVIPSAGLFSILLSDECFAFLGVKVVLAFLRVRCRRREQSVAVYCVSPTSTGRGVSSSNMLQDISVLLRTVVIE